MRPKQASADLLQMQGDWEQRAASNPMYHIDARRLDWNIDEFYAGGETIVASAIDPVIARFGVETANKKVLEIGPGMGRLFPALSTRFGAVVGVEISPTMIELGEKHCPARESARWIAGDGASLTGILDASIDYVISFEVFQHIPVYEPIQAYLAETRRVLKPGGTFQIQLRQGSDSRGQAAFRRVPQRLQPLAGSVLRKTGRLPISGHLDTWLGCLVEPTVAMSEAKGLGFHRFEIVEDHLHPPGMGYWLIGQAPLLE